MITQPKSNKLKNQTQGGQAISTTEETITENQKNQKLRKQGGSKMGTKDKIEKIACELEYLADRKSDTDFKQCYIFRHSYKRRSIQWH